MGLRHTVFVNAAPEETRVALLEDGRLVEFMMERSVEERLAGNIYRGRVENVLPGMQAAFVDIGLERNAFLYVKDALPREVAAEASEGPPTSISDVLKSGQEVVVQIVKEALGTKGPRVTRHITLPGRNLVLMPTVDFVGVSRRIIDEAERTRLRKIAVAVKPPEMGVIVRTAAAGKADDDVASDLVFLTKVWKRITSKAKRGQLPSLLYGDHDLVYRVVRDLLGPDTESVVVDDPAEHAKALEFARLAWAEGPERIHLYDGAQPLFEANGIEAQLEKALRRKVWLGCGGYIVIDRTEALTVIDVNTGKFTGSVGLEDTVLRTNLEAADEIARQLRLRNMGGIIVIDFIDMSSEENRTAVLESLKVAVKGDKMRTSILGFTSLGLIELTRKKVTPSIDEILLKPCPSCEGRGRIRSEHTVAAEIRREVTRWARTSADEALLCDAHPTVASAVIGTGGRSLVRLEKSLGKTLFIRGRLSGAPEKFEIVASGPKDTVQALATPISRGQKLTLRVEATHLDAAADGIARMDGFVVQVEGAGSMVGKDVAAEIIRVNRTFARAKLLPSFDSGESPVVD